MNTMCLVCRWWIIFIYSVGFVRHCFILVDIIGKYHIIPYKRYNVLQECKSSAASIL